LPPAIPLLTPSDLSTRKFNQPFSAPHLPRMSPRRHFLTASCTNAVLGGEERAQELPRDVVMGRDSAFHMSYSRVLRASLPFSSRRVLRSNTFQFFNLPPLPSVFLQNLFLDTARETKSVRDCSTYASSISLYRTTIARSHSKVPLDSQSWLHRHRPY
jgi:hypothetical protein